MPFFQRSCCVWQAEAEPGAADVDVHAGDHVQCGQVGAHYYTDNKIQITC